jgi:hypothetical protein
MIVYHLKWSSNGLYMLYTFHVVGIFYPFVEGLDIRLLAGNDRDR